MHDSRFDTVDLHTLPPDPRTSIARRVPLDPTAPSPELRAARESMLCSAPQESGVPAPTPTESGIPAPPAAYTLHKMIAMGGYGEVWRATQNSLGRIVAVKRLRPSVSRLGAQVQEEFRQEAITAAMLEHPSIVPVHDLGMDDAGNPVIAMKLVRGRTWSHLITVDWMEMGPHEFLARHLPTLIATAQAVAFAHSRGIVHRDLKPSQVMTGEFGEVLLMDWGLALFVGERGNESEEEIGLHHAANPRTAIPTSRTASSPAGTPVYMAPEQTKPTADSIGPWTDIYLLGAILYQLLTGLPPHDAETTALAMVKAQRGVVTPPSHAAPDREVPAELEAICLRALSPDPKTRHARALDFVEDLRDYLSGTNARRQAELAPAESRRLLAEARSDYTKHTEALSEAERARALWPQGAAAPPLIAEILEHHARVALGRRDLGLARSQTERLPAGPAREALLGELRQAEAQRRRNEAQRRAATVAAALLLLAVIAVALVYNASLSEQRDRAEQSRAAAEQARDAAESARAQEAAARAEADRQRDRANKSRNDAEGLVQFLITDLRNTLAPRDPKLELLDAASAKAAEYYDSLDRNSMDGPALANLVQSLSALGVVLNAQSKNEDALRFFGEARRLALETEASSADPVKTAVAASSCANYMVTILLARERGAEARELAESNLRALEKSVAAHPEEITLREALAISHNSRVQVALRSEGVPAIEREILRFEEALDAFVQAGVPAKRLVPYRITNALAHIDVFDRTGRNAEALALLEETWALLQAESSPATAELDLRRLAPELAFKFGKYLVDANRAEEAGAVFRTGIEYTQASLALVPDDLNTMRDYSYLQFALARQLAAVGRNEEALAELDRADEIGAMLLERDPRNPELRESQLTNLQVPLRILIAANRRAEAIATYRAILADAAAAARDGVFPTSQSTIELEAAVDIAAALYRWESYGEALTHWETALALLERIAPERQSPLDWFNWAAVKTSIATNARFSGDLQKARASALDAVAGYRRAGELDPNVDPHSEQLYVTCLGVAELSLLVQDPATADEHAAEAQSLLEMRFVPGAELPPEVSLHLGRIATLRGRAAAMAGDEAGAKDFAQEAQRLVSPLEGKAVDAADRRQSLSWAALLLGDREAAKREFDMIPVERREPALAEALAEHTRQENP